MDEDGSNPNWRRLLAALLVVMTISVAGLALLGTQSSRILSTVGASVGTPGGGQALGPKGQPGSGEGPGSGNEGQGGDTNGPDGASDIAAMQDAARPDLLIIREGSITIEVTDLDAALDDAASAIVALGGYESGSLRSGRDEHAGAQVVYRFPAGSWEEALAAIRGLGDDVLDEQSQTSDVTSEVVDIEARIRNLQVTEAAFQSIMDRATVIKDVLNVQAELTRVRSEIEQLTSKAAQLRGQAAMSTLTVSFTLPETPPIARQEAGFNPGAEAETATARLVAMLQALATAGIWFGIFWLPILLALAVIALTGLFIGRRLTRSSGAADNAMPSADAGA
jgi:uncharacterized protein DUF4349